jgi:hypothetical protein
MERNMLQLLNKASVNNDIGLYFCFDGQNDTKQDANNKDPISKLNCDIVFPTQVP